MHWSSEKLEELKRLSAAGYSYQQIANQIGVTRNAVAGKLGRLGMRQPKLPPPSKQAAAKRQRPTLRLVALFGRRLEDVPIANDRHCSLLELNAGKCRWPINEPDSDNFCFCGNTPLAGFPYCVGHARFAYRPARRSAGK
jgi:GcrA cell cycle regulator